MTELKTRITCPKCGEKSDETMPEDHFVIFYKCKSCGETLKPLKGDCCVFCSYGTVPCPTVQIAWENGELGQCCSGD
ncbi:MAG TPA: hypothetical protein ENJ57_07015 [Rhizobiales bacterium]|nr:hypothetical protein [Hyphomicrobiales bacterium]